MMLTRLIIFGAACLVICLPMSGANCQGEYQSCVEDAAKSCLPMAENDCEKECEQQANDRMQDPRMNENLASCIYMCLVVKETECRNECESNYLTCSKNCEDDNIDNTMSLLHCLLGITVPTMPGI